MNPSHYVSLPLAKRMKEVGFEQRAEYFYRMYQDSSNFVLERFEDRLRLITTESYAAYSVAELAELLYSQPKYVGISKETDSKWRVQFDMQGWKIADTLADAMALMAIYLKEQGII